MERKPLQVLGILRKSLISLSVAINILSINTVYVMVISIKSSWQFDTLIPLFSPHFKVSLDISWKMENNGPSLQEWNIIFKVVFSIYFQERIQKYIL